jgi:hemerythrin superfamily protein
MQCQRLLFSSLPSAKLFLRSTAPQAFKLTQGAQRTFAATAINMSRISDVIKHDHRELEDYYNKIVNTSDHDERERFQNAFVWELARHSIGEEIVVYPAMEKYVSGGKDLAEKDRGEHRKVRERDMNHSKNIMLTPTSG